MFDHGHIGEKWLYLTKVKRNYYLALDEDPPHRSCRNKNYITKAMFLAAVARPRLDPHMRKIFNGKLGIRPFIVKETAQSAGRNRPRGAIVTKAMTSVTKQEVRSFLMRSCILPFAESGPVEAEELQLSFSATSQGLIQQKTTYF